uniref:Periphilin 1 n=1 Tax=Crocodylus porosus TaxID=8502 RepID=A0A7M4EPX1_CROPO
MAYRRDEMWSEGRYEYERLPRERLPPRIHPDEDSGYRWPREDHPASRQPEYRDIRDGFRRKSFYASHYIRERSPHKRDSPFFRESPVNRRDSPHSRSGSSVSSRSYSPERSKVYPFHQSQHSRSKERPSGQSLKTSRDASPSGSTAVPSSKALEKSSRLSEKELAEAASKWAAEKAENADESNLPEITEYDAASSAPLYVEQPEETETNITDATELYEDNQVLGRSKAIATKTKEIEQLTPTDNSWKMFSDTGLGRTRFPLMSLVYRQDCETFGMVVKMLIDKDPSLEKSIQFALRQNLHEIDLIDIPMSLRTTVSDHDCILKPHVPYPTLEFFCCWQGLDGCHRQNHPSHLVTGSSTCLTDTFCLPGFDYFFSVQTCFWPCY